MVLVKAVVFLEDLTLALLKDKARKLSYYLANKIYSSCLYEVIVNSPNSFK